MERGRGDVGPLIRVGPMQGLYGQGKSGENLSFSRWSGKVREFNEKVRENLEKVGEIFLESSYLL